MIVLPTAKRFSAMSLMESDLRLMRGDVRSDPIVLTAALVCRRTSDLPIRWVFWDTESLFCSLEEGGRAPVEDVVHL